MADSADIVNHLDDKCWQMVDECPNKGDFKEFRLTKRMDKGQGKFLFLAQSCEEDGNIYQLTISDTKNGEPFQGVQLITLAIKDQTIVGISCIDNKFFIRK